MWLSNKEVKVKRLLIVNTMLIIIMALLISGCGTYPSAGSGIVLSTSVHYGYYSRYLSITITNYSNQPYQVESFTMKDLSTGETITITSTGGDWLYPGQSRTGNSDPISYYIHGNAQITVCGRFSNGRKACDSTVISL